MPNRIGAKTLKIKEQIVHLEGMTLRFYVVPDSTARHRLAIESDSLPFGNYELIFDVEGNEAGGGMALTGLNRPDDDT